MSTQTALYTTAQVRALDAYAIDVLGIPGMVLMRRAAQAGFNELRRRWPDARRIGVLCGSGNNGGDGFLLAALALEAGLQVQTLALTAESRGDAAAARRDYEQRIGRVEVAASGSRLERADVYVDALFGSGLARAPEGAAENLINVINQRAAPVLALDVPSGLDANLGVCPGAVVRADATVCFVAWKRGLFTHQARDCCGELVLDTLSLPDEVLQQQVASAQLLHPQPMPPRAAVSHKGDFGHVMVVGGDHGFGGAVRLAGEAALRVGAGLVSVATQPANIAALLAGRPELMAQGVDERSDCAALLARASVLALGPGLGQAAWGRNLWAAGMATKIPLVLDADGLNLLANSPQAFATRDVVLTPHPGEAARLLGTDTAAIQSDRFAAVRALADQFAAVVVLKGAGTLIAAPDAPVTACRHGNPGMASGGMGDVLTGVIAGLMAQGLAPMHAACLGVDMHARAADQIAESGQRGMLASDLFEPLRMQGNAHG